MAPLDTPHFLAAMNLYSSGAAPSVGLIGGRSCGYYDPDDALQGGFSSGSGLLVGSAVLAVVAYFLLKSNNEAIGYAAAACALVAAIAGMTSNNAEAEKEAQAKREKAEAERKKVMAAAREKMAARRRAMAARRRAMAARRRAEAEEAKADEEEAKAS